MNDFPWQTFTVGGAGWSLFALAGLAVIKGQLVPRKTHQDVLHDRDEWRAESRIKDAQIAEKDRQLGHLAEVGETQKAVLHAVARLAEQETG